MSSSCSSGRVDRSICRRGHRPKVFISAITVSELLMGVARLHADIGAGLMRRGQLIGAHDLIIAATARHHALSLLTDNVSEFARVPGLHVIEFAE